jgi:hypothetical protein
MQLILIYAIRLKGEVVAILAMDLCYTVPMANLYQRNNKQFPKQLFLHHRARIIHLVMAALFTWMIEFRRLKCRILYPTTR